MDRTQRIFSGKYISFIGSEYTESVGDMILEHYDTEEYHGCIIITWPFDDKHEENLYYKDYIINNQIYRFLDLDNLHERYNKIILYDMEHTGYWIMPWICHEYLDNIDEIWTLWLESIPYFKKYKENIKFMPLRYTKKLEQNYIGIKSNPSYDLGFLGSMGMIGDIANPDYNVRYRHFILRGLTDDIPHYVVCGSSWRTSKMLINDTKFMLDTSQRFTPYLYSQNVVRLQELVSLGKHVLCEESSFNYFPDMVTIVPDIRSRLSEYIENTSLYDFSKIYKELTYKDIDFKSYKKDCLNRFNKIYGDPYIIETPWVENKYYEKYQYGK